MATHSPDDFNFDSLDLNELKYDYVDLDLDLDEFQLNSVDLDLDKLNVDSDELDNLLDKIQVESDELEQFQGGDDELELYLNELTFEVDDFNLDELTLDFDDRRLINPVPEPNPNSTAVDVASWMQEQVQNHSKLYQRIAAHYIKMYFGERFIFINKNGNPAISKDVLKEFAIFTKNTIVWNRRERFWRKRKPGDPINVRMVDE